MPLALCRYAGQKLRPLRPSRPSACVPFQDPPIAGSGAAYFTSFSAPVRTQWMGLLFA